MSALDAADKKDPFKKAVTITLTVVGVLVAAVTFLQNDAALRAEKLFQSGEYTAINATSLLFTAHLDAAQGVSALQFYTDYRERAAAAEVIARALWLGGWEAKAAPYIADARRLRQMAAEVARSNPMLTDYDGDEKRYQETLSRAGYIESEMQQIRLARSRAWSNKANGYIAVLATLAVALFLCGLSLTIAGRVRYLLTAAGVGLALICCAWVLGIVFGKVPRISEQAIQRFVDGLIKYRSDPEDPAALEDFDAALELAPDYASAYFYRAMYYGPSRLTAADKYVQQAVDDARRAIRLGHTTSAAYGNLGWWLYVNGQYNAALEMTEKALASAPADECYWPFNKGIILIALGRRSAAAAAYATAIDCALKIKINSYYRDYFLDVGVTDLEDLAVARPDLEADIHEATRRLKNALALEKMKQEFGADFEPQAIPDVTFSSPIFSATTDKAEAQTIFPQDTGIVHAIWQYAGMRRNYRWLARWMHDGGEDRLWSYATWELKKAGECVLRYHSHGSLNPGEYVLDLFVEGQWLAAGRFTVKDDKLPDMIEHASDGVGVTINYPETWSVVDLSTEEVYVVSAHDPDNPALFYSVVAYQAPSGAEGDVTARFDDYFAALADTYADFKPQELQAFNIAGGDGWLRYYSYTNAEAIGIYGAIAGRLDRARDTVYLVNIEAPAGGEWDKKVDLFNVMLRNFEIAEEAEAEAEE